MAEEIELKLALPQQARRALARHPLLALAQELPGERLVNVYYDTRQQELRARGVALRLRRQGRRWLQTVKCAGVSAGGLSARPEWEQPYAGRFDFDAIEDRRLARWLERRHAEGRLQPVFETVFRRRSWRVEREGSVVAAMLDEGLIRAAERRSPICELELELAAGEPADLFAIAAELAASLPLKPEPLSKAQRGYLLAAGESLPPATQAPVTLDPATPVHEAFRRILQACLATLQANEAGAAQGLDPEYVHQMRLALRRMRSALRIFSGLLPAGDLPGLVSRLHSLADTLGEARDWDILAADVLAPVVAGFPADPRLAALARAVGERRAKAGAAVAQALADPTYGRLLIAVGALANPRQPSDAHPEPLREFAQRAIARLARRTRLRAGRASANDPVSLHRLRIAVKRWRYALEFFAGLLPRHAVRLGRLIRLQSRLGALHDLATAGARLAACSGNDPTLREAVALAGGWHGPRYRRILKRLPDAIAALAKAGRG
ncbi:MAG: CYTH and CHAD domain-containing protein [Rhodocyclaceae bacterium]